MLGKPYSTNRVFYCGGKQLCLTFSLAATGSRVWGIVKNGKMYLSLRKKASNAAGAVEMTVKRYGKSGRKYLDVTSLLGNQLGEGYYTIYPRTKNNDKEFVVIKENEESVPNRVKLAWERGISRVTSKGNVVIPTDYRKRLLGTAEQFKFEVDVSRGYSCRITPYDPAVDGVIKTRSDLVAQAGYNFLGKMGCCQYILPDSQKGLLKLPTEFIHLLEDVDYGVEFNFEEDANNHLQALTISKKSFICKTCGKNEWWTADEKIAKHVCPRCAKNLRKFKTLIPEANLSDMDAIKEGSANLDKKLNEAMDALKFFNARVIAAQNNAKTVI